ncbi:MAG: hypothetical protein E6J90_26580 [Deltaproteobacteria bacterium]|nr:MAG: hypothetical protein E6J90_26580 [Deltaproteobacteria bacterium]
MPPQLERIVMHALAKVPGERYQSASDLATDLERFLHAYSPVFTASKLSNLVRQVVGDPIQVPDDPGFASIEFRDGVMSTHPLDDSELVHAGDELRDENSVIFRVAELGKQAAEPAARRARWPNQPPQPAQHPRQPTPRPSQPPARSSTPPRASTESAAPAGAAPAPAHAAAEPAAGAVEHAAAREHAAADPAGGPPVRAARDPGHRFSAVGAGGPGAAVIEREGALDCPAAGVGQAAAGQAAHARRGHPPARVAGAGQPASR